MVMVLSNVCMGGRIRLLVVVNCWDGFDWSVVVLFG